jgi:hypothetical protein
MPRAAAARWNAGSEFTEDVDLVIAAIGQRPEEFRASA